PSDGPAAASPTTCTSSPAIRTTQNAARPPTGALRDELRRALSISRAKRLAVDQLDPPDSLGALLRERNLLRLSLPTVGPDPRPSIAAAEKRVEETKARLTEEQARLEHTVASRSAWRRLRNASDTAI